MYRIINKKKLYATMIADVIGKIIYLPRKIFNNFDKIKTEEVKEILVIRTAYIGDVMMTVPMLKPLKQLFKDAKITYLTSNSSKALLINNPYIDEIITYDPFWFYKTKKTDYLKFIRGLKKRKFDLIIETRGDIRELLFLVKPLKSRYKLSYDVGGGGYLLTHVVPYTKTVHKVEYHLDMVRYMGAAVNDVEWGLYFTEDETREVTGLLIENGVDRPFICVHPGSRVSLKRWLNARYAQLYDRIINELGLNVVIFGTNDEKEITDEIIGKMKHKPINLTGKVGIRKLAGIILKSELFVCNDSAPMHISASLKRPTVAIFGPSKSIETGPFGDSDILKVVEKDYPCRYDCEEGSCHIDNFHGCMKDIMVEDVFNVVNNILNKRKDKL